MKLDRRLRQCQSRRSQIPFIAQWLELLTTDQQVAGQFLVEVIVYLLDRIRQTDESDHSDDEHQEPNQNSNQNEYKKVS